jgi:hypothetical protein
VTELLFTVNEIANLLRDGLRGAEMVDRLCAVPVDRVHQIAQKVGSPASDGEAARLRALYGCYRSLAQPFGEPLERWMLRPNPAFNDGSPCLYVRAGREADVERILARLDARAA